MKNTFVEVVRPPKPLLRCPSAFGLQLPKLPIVTEVPATAKPKGLFDVLRTHSSVTYDVSEVTDEWVIDNHLGWRGC